MEVNSKHVEKVSIKKVLIKAINLYKENFKVFIILSTIIMAVDLLSDKGLQFFTYSIEQSFNGLFFFLSVIIGLVVIYYSIMLAVSLIKLVALRYENKVIGLLGLYKESKSKVWNYMGVCVLLSFILLIPVLIEMAILTYVSNIILKIILAAIFTIPILYLETRYSLAVILTCLDKGVDSSLSKSEKIVKGNYLSVFVLNILLFSFLNHIYYAINYVNPEFVAIAFNSSNNYQIFSNIISLFIRPFHISITIVLLFELLRIHNSSIEKNIKVVETYEDLGKSLVHDEDVDLLLREAKYRINYEDNRKWCLSKLGIGEHQYFNEYVDLLECAEIDGIRIKDTLENI